MKTNYLFLFIGLTALLTFSACDPESDLDLDKKLNFSPLPVEQQKQKIEDNALEFVEQMEGLLETPAFVAIENFIEIFSGEDEDEYDYWAAPLRVIATDLQNGNPNVLVGLEKQMKIIQDDYDEDEGIVFGEYIYNFESEEFDLERELENKVVFHLPASQAAMESETNNGLISFEFTESKIAIPESEGEKYPASANLSVKIDNKTALIASFTGVYFDDGMPKDVKQTLTIGDFSWEATFKNNKKQASVAYAFKKAKTTLMKLAAETTGKFAYDEIENTMESDGDPGDFVNKIAAQYQVMNLAIKGGIAKVKDFSDAMDAADEGKGLTEKAIRDQQASIMNQYIVGYGYFVDDNKKFADVDFYVEEYEYRDWNGQTYKDYDVVPRFKLSDGSKVTIEEYFESGFGDLIDKIRDLSESFE